MRWFDWVKSVAAYLSFNLITDDNEKQSKTLEESHTPDTHNTFVAATGGGWGDPPERVAGDGGEQADYVSSQLAKAQAYAQVHVEVGDTFEFRLTKIPGNITSPHEIAFGIMMRAGEYGLQPGVNVNETFTFTRLR